MHDVDSASPLDRDVRQRGMGMTETMEYPDGTTATGTAPLPLQSPKQQDQGVYSAEETREMLRQKAQDLGSQKALALACGVSEQFLSDIILGKREPSGKPLEYLGLRRTVRYEP